MCGIAGVFAFARDRRVDPALAQAMADRLAHRGPDGDGDDDRILHARPSAHHPSRVPTW